MEIDPFWKSFVFDPQPHGNRPILDFFFFDPCLSFEMLALQRAPMAGGIGHDPIDLRFLGFEPPKN